MSACPTSVTSADVLIMGIKIVTFGFRAKVLCRYHHSSLVRGFVLHQLLPPTASTNNRVIRVSGYYENRKENISTQRRKAAKQGPILVPAPARETQADKEIGDTEAEILEALNLKNQSQEPNKETEQDLRDSVPEFDSFEQQIRDIDKVTICLNNSKRNPRTVIKMPRNHNPR